MKKIDLGAAATLVSVAQTAKSQATENGSASEEPNDKKNTSAMNDLADLMNTGPTDAPLVPGNVSGEPDLFGNFSSAQPAGNTTIFLTPDHYYHYLLLHSMDVRTSQLSELCFSSNPHPPSRIRDISRPFVNLCIRHPASTSGIRYLGIEVPPKPVGQILALCKQQVLFKKYYVLITKEG